MLGCGRHDGSWRCHRWGGAGRATQNKPFVRQYSDQLYTNAACYMRLRHAVEWIGTVDMDELIEIQHEGGVGIPAKELGPATKARAAKPWYLPEMLDSMPSNINEVALMHCRLMTLRDADEPTGKWKQFDWSGVGRVRNRRLVSSSRGPMMRNCRQDVPAGKSIGRASKVAFSHIHFLFPDGLTDSKHPCSWLWPAGK